MAKHGFGGRKLGSKNKIKVDIETLIRRVEQGSGKSIDEWLASCLMDKRTRVPVLLQLLAYRYGKPKEKLELSGSINHAQIIQEARARVASISAEPAPDRPLLAAPEADKFSSLCNWRATRLITT
jgi:hypothetical protein